MPVNHPYNPRHNPKVYVSKLTEEERLARATPLENLRGLRFRSQTPTAPAPNPSPPQFSTPEISTPEDPTQEVPTVEALAAEVPMAEVPTAEVPTPGPAAQEDPAPDYLPAAWEVVFAAFPELYPEHAERVSVAVTAPEEEHAPRSQTLLGRRRAEARNTCPEAPHRKGLPVVEAPLARRTNEERCPDWRSLDIPVRGKAHANTEAARRHEVPT